MLPEPPDEPLPLLDALLVTMPLPPEYELLWLLEAPLDPSLEALELLSQRVEALVERFVQRVVVPNRRFGSPLVERVLVFSVHAKVGADQIHPPESQVVQQPDGDQHHRTLTLDAERVERAAGSHAIASPAAPE